MAGYGDTDNLLGVDSELNIKSERNVAVRLFVVLGYVINTE